jgi:hypothetical protein
MRQGRWQWRGWREPTCHEPAIAGRPVQHRQFVVTGAQRQRPGVIEEKTEVSKVHVGIADHAAKPPAQRDLFNGVGINPSLPSPPLRFFRPAVPT